MIVGLGHVDLVCRDHAAHTAAVGAGATVLHEPREWPQYRSDYYATFFLDPDRSSALVRPSACPAFGLGGDCLPA